MKALALAPVLALAAFTFAAPPLAEAAPRHGRDCGRRGYSSRDCRPIVRHHRHHRYSRHHHYCRSGCAHPTRYYGAYGYRHHDRVPYYAGYYRRLPPPPPLPPRIHLRHRHHRPRLGVFIGF